MQMPDGVSAEAQAQRTCPKPRAISERPSKTTHGAVRVLGQYPKVLSSESHAPAIGQDTHTHTELHLLKVSDENWHPLSPRQKKVDFNLPRLSGCLEGFHLCFDRCSV